MFCLTKVCIYESMNPPQYFFPYNIFSFVPFVPSNPDWKCLWRIFKCCDNTQNKLCIYDIYISNPVIIKLKVSWYSESYWGVLVIVVAVCLFVCLFYWSVQCPRSRIWCITVRLDHSHKFRFLLSRYFSAPTYDKSGWLSVKETLGLPFPNVSFMPAVSDAQNNAQNVRA